MEEEDGEVEVEVEVQVEKKERSFEEEEYWDAQHEKKSPEKGSSAGSPKGRSLLPPHCDCHPPHIWPRTFFVSPLATHPSLPPPSLPPVLPGT